MFTRQPTSEQIEYTLALLQKAANFDIALHRDTLQLEVYGSIDPISDRLVRLCITALQEKGYLIFASNGYMLAGDDPEPVIRYLNGLYSRANKLTAKADKMYHELKRNYGDEVAAKVEQFPGQTFLLHADVINITHEVSEPPFHKSYDIDGTMHNV
jgi:hypothetical protein